MIYLGIVHYFVCVHIFIGKHSYSNWLLLTKLEDKSLINIYLGSLYFLITTITTVGYGDITCSSPEERIFQIILLAIGSIFYSYIVSTISNFIKDDSNAKIKYNNELNILENIRIANPNISFKLYNNILKYLERKTKCQEKMDVNSLIETLPFTLKNKIIFTIYKYEIKHFKFLKKNDNSEFISEVLNNFISMTAKKNEFLIYEGEMLEEMIFIKDCRISFEAAINFYDYSYSYIILKLLIYYIISSSG
jgi:voltage-gated potassium channel